MDWVFVRSFFFFFPFSLIFFVRADAVDSVAFACVGHLMRIPVWMQAVLSDSFLH